MIRKRSDSIVYVETGGAIGGGAIGANPEDPKGVWGANGATGF